MLALEGLLKKGPIRAILGHVICGSWDFATTYDWPNNPTNCLPTYLGVSKPSNRVRSTKNRVFRVSISIWNRN